MWRAALVALIMGIGVTTAVALRRRDARLARLAGSLWVLTGALSTLTVLLAKATSYGGSTDDVSREAILVLPLAVVMVVGGAVLPTFVRGEPPAEPKQDDH